jgi:hypothetical protein
VEDPTRGVSAAQTLDPFTAARYGSAANPGDPAADAANYSATGEMIKGRMPDLVKGAGLAQKGGNTVLSDPGDILTRSAQAALALRVATAEGYRAKSNVVKSFKPDFLSQFGALRTALEAPSLGEQIGQMLTGVASPDLVRSFTAGNLGIGSVAGLVPFNLLAPTRLIYPVYTVDN